MKLEQSVRNKDVLVEELTVANQRMQREKFDSKIKVFSCMVEN